MLFLRGELGCDQHGKCLLFLEGVEQAITLGTEKSFFLVRG